MIYFHISPPFRKIMIIRGHCEVDALAQSKISKRQFLKDIENSFHEVTHIGLEPHHFFSF